MPVDHLLGEGIQASDLNNDCLGTALDSLYNHGITELFYQVSSQALSVYGIKHRFVHLDKTSFSLHGEYNSDQETESEHVKKITKGYSKDNNPDLNQVVLSLMCSYKNSIQIWLEVLSGNNSHRFN
ncbi:MAG: IS1634 family transposase [Spirochaetales bacterium]|nr:IS1634 family transposase [Spirochaetales bacterium]